MVYSGPSSYAMETHQREQDQLYEEGREAFEFLLDHAECCHRKELAEWFGNGGVTDYGPIFRVLVRAREAGLEGAAELLNQWADSFAKDKL
jgi:hypothetical protein